MKRTLLLGLAGLAALWAGSAGAVTATNTFSVSITLNSACEVRTVPTIAFTYTSFQTAAANAGPSTFTVRCTDQKPISSIRLDDGAGGLAAAASQSYTDSATGLNYTLTLSGVPTVGAGVDQTVSVSGTMPPGQSGQCNAGTCDNAASTNKTRTITITY